MSNSWNEFCDGAGRFFDKLSSEAVGKLTYAKLSGGSDNAEQIEASLSRIAELRKTEKEIERDIKEAKAEKEAQKEADKAVK